MNYSKCNFVQKILELCRKRKFLEISNVKPCLEFGPLGYRMGRGIRSEWRHSFNNVENASIFDNATMNFQTENDFTRQYKTSVEMLGNDALAPFGVAQESLKRSKRIFDSENDEIIPWYPQFQTSLSLNFFCPSHKSNDWFNHWHIRRLQWLKSFSSSPSNFTISDLGPGLDSIRRIQLCYEMSNQKLPVETLTCYGSDPLKKIFNEKEIIPNLITSQTTLEQLIFTYLIDAHVANENKTIMRLHPIFAPYKVSLAISSYEGSDFKPKLIELAEHIMRDLKYSNIEYLPNPNLYKDDSLESQYQRFDESGVPYTIVLEEDTLKTGIVGLRNRDTTLKEETHVSEICYNLLRYLQCRDYI